MLDNNLDRFIHLRLHTSYSLSEGAVKVGDVPILCLENNMPAVAVTDSGNLFGSLEVALACRKKGVQLIPAVEVNYMPTRPDNLQADESELNKIQDVILDDSEDIPRQNIFSHNPDYEKIILIAKDEQGYANLLHLVSNSFLRTKDYINPIITKSELQAHNDGLICLSGGYNGILNKKIATGQATQAEATVQEFLAVFGDRFYIELNRLGIVGESEIEDRLLSMAAQHNVPIVATNNIMFPSPDMYEAQDILMCIAGGSYASDENRPRQQQHQYFKSTAEMCELFEDLPEAIENTVNIAKRCSFIPDVVAPQLPAYPTKGGRSDAEELQEVAFLGLCQRLGLDSNNDKIKENEEFKEYFVRLDYEISVINKMDFPGYFLIVSDFIRWAKANDIPVGPGRGSGAGSVVAWALEITNLDPLRFGLLFERFLNPERVSMPDFDVDFCQERRGEVIAYVQRKYGHEHVAQIITFGKLQARAVLRDVGRVLQLPYPQVDRICKMIPFNPVDPVTLAKAVEMDPELQQARKEDEAIAKLIDIGLKLEGMHRHASTHAAGLVIGRKPLIEIVPLYTDHRSSIPITQYSMKYVELASLVKFDFLGLKTLTLVAKTCQMVKRNEGVELDMDNMPFDDKQTFEMLAEGKGVGVFQMESAGMRDAMRKMKVDSIEDIIALISLYRPGPMENIPRYIACKHGKEKPDYLHPLLKDCLKETYGVIIYQEQVMQIAQILGGYSLGAADLLRRAMGKKIKAEMDAQAEKFVTGAVANNVEKAQAEAIFNLVAKFAGYGFNKSHAAAYAAIGYQTAYLKAHYPAEFLCSCMNQIIHDTDKILVFREEARRMGIDILPPDINKSGVYFDVYIDDANNRKKSIRYALSALKNVGSEAMENLVREREKKGEFTNLTDFVKRVDSNVTNKRQLESLAQSGAFDSIHQNRAEIYENTAIISRFNQVLQQEKNDEQSSLFGGVDDNEIEVRSLKLEETSRWNSEEQIYREFSAIGFYLNNHPVSDYMEIISDHGFIFVEDLEEKVRFTATPVQTVLDDGKYRRQKIDYPKFRMIGVPNKVVHRTANGRRFSYFFLSDPTGMFEVNIFNEDLINSSRNMLDSVKPIIVNVEARRDEGGIRLIASSIQLAEEYLITIKASMSIKLSGDDTALFHKVRDVINLDKVVSDNNNQGKFLLISFDVNTDGYRVKLQLPENNRITKESFLKIKEITGLNYRLGSA